MNVSGRFRRLIVAFILEFRHRESYRRIQQIVTQLRAAESLDAESLQVHQQKKLSDILLHAYRQVPYYHNLLNECGVIQAGDQLDMSKFRQIPLLDKKTIHTNMEALKSNDLNQRQWKYNASGGSTGEPVRLIQDRNFSEWQAAVKIVFDEWTGYAKGDRKVVIWGSKRDLLIGKESSKARLMQWLKNLHILNAYRMTEQKMKIYVKQINILKPVQILAYADSIDELAKFIDKQSLQVYSPKSIMTSAGTLFSEMRERIERVFATSVFNRYGSREVSDMACECEKHEGLHVSALTHYIEIIRPDGTPSDAGEVGEIVVTSLVNYAMPLIRYRIGDLAAWAKQPCSCGSSWPLLQEVTGRVSDMFITRDGSRINGKYFHHLFYYRDWIRRFQVIQEEVEYIRVLIVLADNAMSPDDYCNEIDEITKKIKLIISSECRVEFECLNDIPPTPSGKYMYTISKVSAV